MLQHVLSQKVFHLHVGTKTWMRTLWVFVLDVIGNSQRAHARMTVRTLAHFVFPHLRKELSTVIANAVLFTKVSFHMALCGAMAATDCTLAHHLVVVLGAKELIGG